MKRLVLQILLGISGLLALFTSEGGTTRIDHELEMNPKGVFKLLVPMIRLTGRKNLEQTAAALQRYLESR